MMMDKTKDSKLYLTYEGTFTIISSNRRGSYVFKIVIEKLYIYLYKMIN